MGKKKEDRKATYAITLLSCVLACTYSIVYCISCIDLFLPWILASVTNLVS